MFRRSPVQRSPELGHPAFQHPQRSQDRVYSAEVDRFSHLAIYTSIHCLTVGRENLWKRFNNSDNLLFQEADFRNPGNSEAFRTLWKLPDTDSRALVGRLVLACEKPLDQVPLLDEVADGEVYPLTLTEEQEVESLLRSAPTSHPVAIAETPSPSERPDLWLSEPGLEGITGSGANWPEATDYFEAVMNLDQSMGDEELRAGQVAVNPLGLPMTWAGESADVFRIRNASTGNSWALKCFTREVTGQADRYRHIAAHLDRARLPFMVDFKYLEQGIRVRGEWYPALKMHWVEGGIHLNEFIEQYLNRARILKQLLRIWVKMADRLRQAKVDHCDLQHGNVLMVPQAGGRLALRLIDYDGVHVPSLAGTRSPEFGHPAFQHPQRSRGRVYSAEVDRFSHLAIYTSIHCLTVGREELWKRFNNGENLLFREEDYRRPAESEAFCTLWKLPDTVSRALVGRLALACEKPLDQVPLLDEVADGEVYPLTQAEEQEVESLLGSAPTTHPVAVAETTETRSALAISEGLTSRSSPVDESLIKPSAKLLLARLLKWLSPLDVPRLIDRRLKQIAGEENAILHNFMRIVTLVGMAVPVFFSVQQLSRWAGARDPVSLLELNITKDHGVFLAVFIMPQLVMTILYISFLGIAMAMVLCSVTNVILRSVIAFWSVRSPQS